MKTFIRFSGGRLDGFYDEQDDREILPDFIISDKEYYEKTDRCDENEFVIFEYQGKLKHGKIEKGIP